MFLKVSKYQAFVRKLISRIKALGGFLCACCLAAMVTACVTEDVSQEWCLQPGDALPHFEVTTLDGERVSWEDSFSADLVIVFFNSTCGDCRRELPEIQKRFEENQTLPETDRAQYICIAREESAEDVARYWDETGLSMPVSPQPGREVYALFASSGIPRVFVARDGKIITLTL